MLAKKNAIGYYNTSFSPFFSPSLLARSECYPLINPFGQETANITDSHRQLLCE